MPKPSRTDRSLSIASRVVVERRREDILHGPLDCVGHLVSQTSTSGDVNSSAVTSRSPFSSRPLRPPSLLSVFTVHPRRVIRLDALRRGYCRLYFIIWMSPAVDRSIVFSEDYGLRSCEYLADCPFSTMTRPPRNTARKVRQPSTVVHHRQVVTDHASPCKSMNIFSAACCRLKMRRMARIEVRCTRRRKSITSCSSNYRGTPRELTHVMINVTYYYCSTNSSYKY